MVGEKVGRGGRALEPENLQDEVLHPQDLLLRVGVVRDVAEL